MPDIPRFHLALPVLDLTRRVRSTRIVLAREWDGRTSDGSTWICSAIKVSLHLVDGAGDVPATNSVDGEQVPARHFGVILDWDAWHALRDRLVEADQSFLIRPQIRFEGGSGEQATLFVRDPSGNAVEVKAFRDDAHVFRTEL